MTHYYKYENMREEDRNALIPAVRHVPLFASWDTPVFDGPQPHARIPNNLKLNTEGDE